VADDVHSLAIAQGSEEGAQGRRLSLRPLLEEAVDELRGIADERQVRIEMREPIPDVQVTPSASSWRSSTWWATPSSTPIRRRRTVVRLSVQRDEEGFWRISVSDNGMGIPDEMQDRVFEQFVRAHPGVADGTGLGLAIARSAIEQMGGRIWLESEPGVGTTFHFTVVDPPAAREIDYSPRRACCR